MSHGMTLRTHFNCDRVQYTSVLDRHDRSHAEEVWQPASVFVSEVNENANGHTHLRFFPDFPRIRAHGRPLAVWLMVSLKTEGDPVVVWRAIQEGWNVACDEVCSSYKSREARTYKLEIALHDNADAQEDLGRVLRHCAEVAIRCQEGLLVLPGALCIQSRRRVHRFMDGYCRRSASTGRDTYILNISAY